MTGLANLDPVSATAIRLAGYDHLVTDYSPEGHAAHDQAKATAASRGERSSLRNSHSKALNQGSAPLSSCRPR